MTDKISKPQFISVPFAAESSNGLTEYNGIAKFSPAGIVIEFDSMLLGLIGSEVREVKVAADEILDIRFRRGIFRFFAQIQFRLKNFTKLSALPNSGGKVRLSIKREYFEIACQAVAKMQTVLEVERESLPPAHSSISHLFDGSEDDTRKLKEPK